MWEKLRLQCARNYSLPRQTLNIKAVSSTEVSDDRSFYPALQHSKITKT